ncbi:sensor histidine kinase [Robiginitalea aurantiaca]|uniref:histidine kinase n=1 Tax=Robiginitalea aurantiaca TaxID=3056915 RepID=A0ABT7WDF3_9FLAO|nr:ATP-binding protein [Robiginitalea aurantiaca]MDM9630940.1 ATP-binding protein [Robiginitalea aurantiaca]
MSKKPNKSTGKEKGALSQTPVKRGNRPGKPIDKLSELQETLRQRERALEIEAALERVRARAMDMQSSEELSDVLSTLFQQFDRLGIDPLTVWLTLWNTEENTFTYRSTGISGKRIQGQQVVEIQGMDIWKDLYDKWKSGASEDVEVLYYAKEDLEQLFTLMAETFESMPKGERLTAAHFPEGGYSVQGHCKFGYIGYTHTRQPTVEEREILTRFAGEFGRVYQRFLDLKKAEKQARESEIQLALERVRARTMAMHRSEELSEVAAVLFEQIENLGDTPERLNIGIVQEEEGVIEFWSTEQGGQQINRLFRGSIEEPTTLAKVYSAWKAGKKSIEVDQTGEDLQRWISHLEEVIGLPFNKKLKRDRRVHSAVFFRHGMLLVSTPEPIPESSINLLGRFGKVFEQTYTRFIDLKKAEAQVREAEIQLSLERIRARAMAMQESSELTEVLSVIFQQLKTLGVETVWTHLTLLHLEENAFTYRMTGRNGKRIMAEEKIALDASEHWAHISDSIKSPDTDPDPITRFEVPTEGLDTIWELFDGIFSKLPKGEKVSPRDFPNGLYTTQAYCKFGFLGINQTREANPEEADILLRFTTEFSRLYQRFLDIQKAEAQTREAQIEAALERVRAASLAMHNSSELFNVINILSEQLNQLGIGIDAAMINEKVGGSKDWHMWLAISSGSKEVYTRQEKVHVPYIRSAAFDRISRADKEGKSVFSDQLTKSQKDSIFEHYFNNSNHRDVPQTRQDYIFSCPGLSRTTVLSNNSFIQFYRYSLEVFTDEENQVLERFGSVFDQSYTRFIDLKNVEAQAREALIETALERVRSRSMAMHSTKELLEVVVVLFNQLKALEVDFIQAWISIWHLDEGYFEMWLSPIAGHGDEPIYHKQPSAQFEDTSVKSWLNGDRFSYVSLPGEEVVMGFLVGMDERLGGHYFEQLQKKNRYDRLEFVDANHKYGTVSMSWHETSSEEDKETLYRFAKVFEQTYTRFLDLQRAEAQAREAKIEAGLERVRSKTMAMHNSQDVSETVATLFEEVKKLGLDESIRCGIGILEGYDGMETWSANAYQDGEIDLRMGMLNMEIHPMLRGLKKAWKNGESGYQYDYDREDVQRYYKALNNEPEYPFNADLKRLPEKQFHNSFFFSEGILFSFTENRLTEEAKNILRRFASVFGQTYRRYLDLQKAEAQARESQIEASLERVRSKTMAMHNSQDVSDTVITLFQEVVGLGLDNSIRCGIGIHHENDRMETWSVNSDLKGDVDLKMGMLNMGVHPMLVEVTKAREKGVKRFYHELTGEDVTRYYRALNNEPEYPLKVDLKTLPDKQYNNVFFFRDGVLFAFTQNPLSEEANRVLERFASVFGQTYRRYLDLQKAEAQAREAQIEAALERIRARAMAMHSTDELTDVLGVLFDQFDFLGINPVLTHLTLFDEENETFTLRIATSGTNRTIAEQQIDVNAVEAWKNSFANWKKSELHALDCIDYPPEVLPYLWDVLHEVMNALPEDQRIYASDYPEGLYTTQGHCNYGYIGFNHSRRATEEEKELVVRFAKEFGRLYQRFLDIQKAEAQAREAQIEAALERVRAKTMAMHNTEDIADMVTTFFNELLSLGIGNSTRCGIGILNPSQVMQVWTASLKDEGAITLHSGPLDMRSHSLLQGLQKAWSEGESLYEYTLEGAQKLSYFKVINEAPEYPVKVALDKLPDSVWHNSFIFPNGTLFVFSESPIKEEIRDIFTRFASVFGQTYIRFLDLERAEKQARESRIEAALERVRAKAMAMHSSEDLRETITVIFKEFKKLEIQALRLGLGLLDAKDPIGEIVTSRINDKGEIIEVSGKFRLEGHPVLEEIYSHLRSQEDYFPVLEGNEIKSYYEGLEKSVDVQGLGTSSKHYGCFLYFPEGCLYAWAATPHSEEQISILRKFSRVVEITYRRYNDLVEAEAREKEAIKQASLDRVRAEIASMRTAKDLERITPLVWKELTTLGIPFFRCGVFIMDEVNQMVHVYLTTPGGKALAAMDLPFDFDMSLIQKGVDHWRRQQILVEHWDQAQFVEMTKKLMKQGQVKSAKSYQAGEQPPERLVLHQVPFAQGMLYVGSAEPLSDLEMDILQSLTRTFAVAYARYEDFRELEKAKLKVENTLDELKATQSQLIQSEKMASLGELTAGIAHEIKNPLNFVNNFSDVSRELLEELLEEMEKGDLEEVKALTGDLVNNLDKIVHHGRRADSIVKGMLQHSRSSDGQREPTDLNALTDEYVRLAYHGLRAKDKSFNATINTDFDPKLGTLDVVPQDIGRVVLNLLTNAFYAVNEKSAGGGASEKGKYEPTVSVRTKRENGQLKISISDNGGGIPEKVLEKIFQPFFTTKPTGEGTGLGLSLSYDIVKAHGGELKVETTQGEGTTFYMNFKTETT